MKKKLFASLVLVGLLVSGMFSGIVKKAEAATVTKPIASTFYKSASYDDYFYGKYCQVHDKYGNTVNAKTTTSTTLTSYSGNNNFSYGTVSFVDYDKVTRTTYKVTARTKAYKKASTTYKLTAKNSNGKTVNVNVPTGNVMTKVSTYWYKDSFSYTNYVKVKGKWTKRTKTATVYVPAKYVKGYKSYVWKKHTKKATGYFWTPDGQTLAVETLQIVNSERSKAGLKPLEMDWDLQKVARIKSCDMAQNDYFSHQSPTYGSPFDMMKHFGIQYGWAGENIAAGQRTPQQVMQSWMNSPGHRANILHSQFTYIGVGYCEGGSYGVYWTQQFISK